MMPLRQPRTHFFRVIYLCLQVKTEKGENLYAQKSDKFPRVTVKCHMVGNDGGEQESVSYTHLTLPTTAEV